MPLFILIISVVIAFHLRLMYINKRDNGTQSLEQYLSEDYSANFARARNIDEKLYVRLTEEDFPFMVYDCEGEEELIRIQDKVKQNIGAPIINSGISTNIEIKKSFGLSNLQTVIYGEENFTALIQNLNKWASLLIKRGNAKDAELILEKTVFIGSDISETYILLYKLYCEADRYEKIEELIKKAQELPEIAKTRVLGLINKDIL